MRLERKEERADASVAEEAGLCAPSARTRRGLERSESVWKESLPGQIVRAIPSATDVFVMCSRRLRCDMHDGCVRMAETMPRAMLRFASWCSPYSGSRARKGSGKQGITHSTGCGDGNGDSLDENRAEIP